MIGGDGLRGEERQPGRLVSGELGDDRGRDPGIGPGHLRAPALPHRQRHHHVAQQHRDVDRRVRHQGEPERDQRVRIDIQGQGQVNAHRVAEHALADLHRQHRGVQRDDLPGTGDHDVAGLCRQPVRAVVARAGPAGTEPLSPDPAERPVAGEPRLGAERLAHVLADQDVPGFHRHPGAVPCLLPDRQHRFPDLPGDAGMSPGFPQPPVIGAADQPGPAPSVLPPDQGPVADLVQAQQPGLLRVQRRQLRDLGVAALGERGGVGVVLGLRLARPRVQAAAAAETGGDFQQVRLPQPGQLPPPRRQVPGTGLLPSPARPRCRRPRRGKAARMTGQELHAHLLPGPVRPGQQDPAQVRLAELDRPLPAVQHHNGPR